MHNIPIATTPKAFDLTPSAFLLVAFLTGIADALQTPTLSLFLMDGVHARPGVVGFFFAGGAVIGILVGQFLAGRSDRKSDRRNLIVFCCVLGMLAYMLFAWNRDYFILLFVEVFLNSFRSTTNPQVLTLAREHTDHTGREVITFSSVLRTQVSLTQVISLPLTYTLAMGFSFTVMYLSTAMALVVCDVIVRLFLPSVNKDMPLATGTVETPHRNRRGALLLLIICTLMWGTDSLYIINMPLFIINELRLPEKLAGIMIGTVAGLEIPAMLIAGYFAERPGERLLMRVVVVIGFFFYAGMLLARSPAILLGLQLLNAIYIGVLGGTGMLYFRDLMPRQAGSATTLYMNIIRVGWIIAGSLAGIAAEIWSYHAMFWFTLTMIVTTAAYLAHIEDV